LPFKKKAYKWITQDPEKNSDLGIGIPDTGPVTEGLPTDTDEEKLRSGRLQVPGLHLPGISSTVLQKPLWNITDEFGAKTQTL